MIKDRIIALALCLSYLMTSVSPLSLAYGITDNINNIEQVQSDILEMEVSDPASDEVEDVDEALDDSDGEEILDDYNLDDEEETSDDSNSSDDEEKILDDSDLDDEESSGGSDSDDVVAISSELESTQELVVDILSESGSALHEIGSELVIADIKVVESATSEVVTDTNFDISLDVSKDSPVNVLHFLEDVSKIDETTPIMSVDGWTPESLITIDSAIQACFEATGISDAVAVEVFEDVEPKDGKVSISVDSFSIFAAGDICINTYKFYLDGELVNTQIVVPNSEGLGRLLEPEAPYKKDHEFLGWKESGTNNYIQFGNIPVDRPTGSIVEAHAEFSEEFYVYFMYEAKENADILDALGGKPGDTISTSEVDYPLSLDKHVVSWHTDPECLSEDIEFVTIEDHNIILYPKVELGSWVTFYTQGGSYIEPMFYSKNETIQEPSAPSKEGYSFIGWFTESGEQFEFHDQTVEESITLIAHYQAEIVNYTVQLVLQNADTPDQYDTVLGAMIVKEALCGSEVKATDISEEDLNSAIGKLSSSAYFKANQDFFYYSDTKNATEKVVVESDGSTVLYVYYDRYMTEINYYLNYGDTQPWLTHAGLYDQLCPTKYWPRPTPEEYENFGDWETEPNKYPAWTGRFRFSFTWDDVKEMWVFNVYAAKGADAQHSLFAYVQAINPDGTVPDVGVHVDDLISCPPSYWLDPDRPENQGNAGLAENFYNPDFESLTDSEITVDGNWVLYEVMKIPATLTSEYATLSYYSEWYPGFTTVAFGFDLFAKNSGSMTDCRVDDFSERSWDSYVECYVKNGNSYVSQGKSEGSASKLISDTKTRWYLESDRWYAVNAPVKLVRLNGEVYMRLLRNYYTLKFMSGEDTIAEFDDVYFETNLGLDKFAEVSNLLEAPAGYEFDGWFTSPSLTEDTRFSLASNTMPANDLVLYAKWKSVKVELDVHVTIDGTDTIIDGFNGFTIKYGSVVDKDSVDSLKGSVAIPEGAIWYGWYERINIGGGKTLLVPFNFDKQLITDIVLYPFYSYMTPVGIKYDVNGGEGTPPVDQYNYALGRGAVVLPNEGLVAPEGKVFTGWNTSADGSGKHYYPGDVAIIGSDHLTLYAQWGDTIGNISLVLKSGIGLADKTFNLLPNSVVELQNPEQLWDEFTVPDGCIFLGWNTAQDGSGEMYQAGDKIVVTADNIESTLYAQWEFTFAELTISHTMDKIALEDQSFAYQVSCNGTELQVAINIPKGQTSGSVTLKDLAVGLCTVTNLDWAWRYDIDSASETMMLTSGPNNEFEFTSERVNPYWCCSSTYTLM